MGYRRVMMFDSLVKSVIVYGAEIFEMGARSR
jgi:hypothetical protein